MFIEKAHYGAAQSLPSQQYLETDSYEIPENILNGCLVGSRCCAGPVDPEINIDQKGNVKQVRVFGHHWEERYWFEINSIFLARIYFLRDHSIILFNKKTPPIGRVK